MKEQVAERRGSQTAPPTALLRASAGSPGSPGTDASGEGCEGGAGAAGLRDSASGKKEESAGRMEPID